MPQDNTLDEANAQTTHERGEVARRSATPYLLGLVTFVLLIVIVATLLQVFVAQRIPELTEERLLAALEQWEEFGPPGYDMEITIRGAQPGLIKIEVRGSEVTTMTRDGRSPPPRTWDVWSVPGMFDTLERELVLAEDPQHEMGASANSRLHLHCEFDAQFGIPRRYHRYTTGNAPEIYWHVSKFEPR